MPANQGIRLSLGNFMQTLKRTVREFREDNLTDWAAALTYYGVLAIFPALLALVSVLGLIGNSATQPLIDNLGTVAPGPAKDIFTSAIQNLQKSQGAAGVAFVIGLGAALWSASGYVAAFMRASNAIYDVEEGRPIWKTLPTRVLTTLVLLLMLAVVAIGVTLTGGLARQVGNLIGVGGTAVDVWNIAKWPVILVVVMTMFAFLYWAAPNVKQPKFRWISPGSVVGVLLWILASAAFAFYVAELRLVQQDLRRARRRDRLPRLALDLEHRRAAGRRVQRRARARPPDRGGQGRRTGSRSSSRATRARWRTSRARRTLRPPPPEGATIPRPTAPIPRDPAALHWLGASVGHAYPPIHQARAPFARAAATVGAAALVAEARGHRAECDRHDHRDRHPGDRDVLEQRQGERRHGRRAILVCDCACSKHRHGSCNR